MSDINKKRERKTDFYIMLVQNITLFFMNT
jgi:hypothetical protein